MVSFFRARVTSSPILPLVVFAHLQRFDKCYDVSGRLVFVHMKYHTSVLNVPGMRTTNFTNLEWKLWLFLDILG